MGIEFTVPFVVSGGQIVVDPQHSIEFIFRFNKIVRFERLSINIKESDIRSAEATFRRLVEQNQTQESAKNRKVS